MNAACSVEPSPQVWFGKQEWFSHQQENNWRQHDCNNNYYNYYTEIILYLRACVHYNLHSMSKKCCVKIKKIWKRHGWNEMVELEIDSNGKKLRDS